MQKTEREVGHEDIIPAEAERNKCHRAKRTGRTPVQILSNHTRAAGQADMLKVARFLSKPMDPLIDRALW